MKVFWSWQSDTPGKTGRHFVRDAIAAAIDDLKEPNDIEEPTEREAREALHLDHDRKGVSGSPDLARTILDKIDQSAVLIADVTPVATIPPQKSRPEKRIMNPNVAIELGYALKVLTDHNILMVVNTWYGGREFLPFDLAHKAGPIFYCLAPDADDATRKTEAAELKSVLVDALKPYLARAIPKATAAALDSGLVRQNTEHRAIEIEFQPTEPFMRKTTFPAGNARFEVYVKIKNCGNGFISECVTSIVDIKPKADNDRYTVLAPLNSLAKGEHRFVLVASFNEVPITNNQQVYDVVTFAFATGWFSGGFTTIQPPIASMPALITIEAKALECRTEQKQLKLWVGENRKLYMAEA